VDDNTIINLQGYVGLLISSAANLLLPLGYDKKSLTASLAQRLTRIEQSSS